MITHDAVEQNMRELAAAFAAQGIVLRLPPATNVTLGTRYTDMDPGKMLAAEFAYDAHFANPLGTIQGGFMCAAFDDVCGPLTYMAAKRPVHTIEMSTSFLRPFSIASGPVTVRAEVVAQTKSLLVIKAEARSRDGKLLAICSQHGLIANDQNMNHVK
jgi:uncharacterized protein (TIGR00369 family)